MPALSGGLSLYLDLVRLLAALSVFGFHLGYGKLAGPPFQAFHTFGSNAVIAFFVLSGFVISHVALTRERGATAYAVARLARLYSVALPALLAVPILDGIGSHMVPDLYPIRLTLDSFIACLFFTNAVWQNSQTFGSMVVYWSLGYEAWYYVIAGLFIFCPKPGRFVWPALAALFAGPHIVALFPTWLLGAGLYRFGTQCRPRPLLGLTLFSLPLFGYFVAQHYGVFEPIAAGIDDTPLKLAVVYFTAAIFATHVLGAHLLSPWLGRLLGPVGRPIRWLAGASFTLYLLHLPFAFFFRSVMAAWEVGSWQSTSVIVLGTLACVLVFAQITERQKGWWRRLFERLIPDQPAPLPDPGVVLGSRRSPQTRPSHQRQE